MAPALEEKKDERRRVTIPISFERELAGELRARAKRDDEPVAIIVRRLVKLYLRETQ